MNLSEMQTDLIADLRALRDGSISVSQARARASLARTVVEAERTEVVKQKMLEDYQNTRTLTVE